MLRPPRVEAILLSLRILAAYTASLTNNNREVTMLRRVLALSLLMAGMFSAAAAAQELMTEKKLRYQTQNCAESSCEGFSQAFQQTWPESRMAISSLSLLERQFARRRNSITASTVLFRTKPFV